MVPRLQHPRGRPEGASRRLWRRAGIVGVSRLDAMSPAGYKRNYIEARFPPTASMMMYKRTVPSARRSAVNGGGHSAYFLLTRGRSDCLEPTFLKYHYAIFCRGHAGHRVPAETNRLRPQSGPVFYSICPQPAWRAAYLAHSARMQQRKPCVSPVHCTGALVHRLPYYTILYLSGRASQPRAALAKGREQRKLVFFGVEAADSLFCFRHPAGPVKRVNRGFTRNAKQITHPAVVLWRYLGVVM